MIEIVKTIPSHMIELRKNIREEDAREIRNYGGCLRRILWQTYHETPEPRTALVDGMVAGIYGCIGTVIGEVGKPWMLATTVADRFPIEFALLYRQEIKKMLENYEMLENWVDSTYDKSIRLMKIIGFNVDEPAPYGPKGALFCRFWMRAK